MFEGGKSISSIIAGVAVLILGGIPLGNSIGIFSFTLPEIPKIVLQITLAAAGFYLIIDGFFELGMHPGMAWVSIFFGAGCALAGILATLADLSTGGMALAFMTSMVINILFVIVGILLIIGAFMF
jgi:hypothetical protein